jgi:hypothetical protein
LGSAQGMGERILPRFGLMGFRGSRPLCSIKT